MLVAILQKPKTFLFEDRPLPGLEHDEVLVKTMASGICTSELDMWEGKASGLEFPRFIGHEPAGRIEAVGKDVRGVAPGDHVAAWSEGKSYAEYFVSKESYLYKLKKDTPFDLALGEPISCAVNGVRKANPQLHDSVCIVGCGFMGLIMLQVFRIAGAGLLIAVDSRESVLDLCRSLGATHTFNPGKTDVRAEVKKLTGGKGVDIGVEGAGIQQTLELVTDLVRMEGKLEIFGFHQGAPRSVNWGYWNWMAFQIINGHSRSASTYLEGMRLGLQLLEAGKLDMRPLVTHRFGLKEINRAFEIASSKPEGFVKAVITF